MAVYPWPYKMNANFSPAGTSSCTSKSPPWLGLSVLLLAGFVTIFDLFVVNVAIPSMQAGLGASLAQIGFIVVAYELAFGVLLITGAAWAICSAGAGCSWSAWAGSPRRRRCVGWLPAPAF